MEEYEVFKKSGEICIKHSNTEFAYHCEDGLQNTFTDQFYELLSGGGLIGIDNEEIWAVMRRTGCFYYKEFDFADFDIAIKSLFAEMSASDNKYRSILVRIEGDITVMMRSDDIENIREAVSGDDDDDDINVIYSVYKTDANKAKVSVWAGI